MNSRYQGKKGMEGHEGGIEWFREIVIVSSLTTAIDRINEATPALRNKGEEGHDERREWLRDIN